jgi:DNA-binding NarL/FixJ family response regulator
MEIRVAIFEDNKLVRDALQTILNGTSGFTCCGAFTDGNKWESDINRSGPDVVLMDIGMPGLNGIDITRKISEGFPHIKILIQTVFNESEKIFLALCAGASGYILKNDPPHKFIEAIKDVYNGGAPFSSSVAKKVLSFFANQNVILISPGSEDYHLSEREKEILRLMTDTLNYKVIAEKLYISYETVRTHVKNIYKKLHVTSRSEAVMKAIQQGVFRI